MARKALLERELKRQKLAQKYAVKRAELKAGGDLSCQETRTRIACVTDVRLPADHVATCVSLDFRA